MANQLPPETTEIGAVDDGAELLLFETSPYGNVDAIVQQDGRTIYFYLNPRPLDNIPGSPPNTEPPLPTKACWVRNLQTGPYVINEDEMRSGMPPMLPRTHVKSTASQALPAPDDLRITWFEEGNGAALIENSATERSLQNPDSKILAVIPPWSGSDGFHGYAADCTAESPLCWPLPDSPPLVRRLDRAAEFWQSFQQTAHPFVKLQAEILEQYRTHFSSNEFASPAEPTYFSIDGGQFPPRGLIHYQNQHTHILATVAMSLCPQPTVELASEEPTLLRRIELAIELPLATPLTVIETAKRGLSGLANYPWRNFRWLGHGHTCQFAGVFPKCDTAQLIHDRELHADRQIHLPSFRNDPINLIWLVQRS